MIHILLGSMPYMNHPSMYYVSWRPPICGPYAYNDKVPAVWGAALLQCNLFYEQISIPRISKCLNFDLLDKMVMVTFNMMSIVFSLAKSC